MMRSGTEDQPQVAAPAPEISGQAADAFGALYENHARALYYLALRFLGDPAQAEDVTQEVFLKALRHWDKFRGDSNPRTWLYRIAINRCHDALNSWRRRRFVPLEEEFDSAAPDSEEPLRVVETRELGERIEKVLAQLPEDHRLLLLLIADEEMSYQEVAELTGQTVDAVRGKLHRARKAFIQKFRRTE